MVCQLELVSNSALSRNALVSLVIPSQARKVSCLCPSQSKPLRRAEQVRYRLNVGVLLATVPCS